MRVFGRRSKKKFEEMTRKRDIKGLIKARDDDRVRDDAIKALADNGEQVIEPLVRKTKKYLEKRVDPSRSF